MKLEIIAILGRFYSQRNYPIKKPWKIIKFWALGHNKFFGPLQKIVSCNTSTESSRPQQQSPEIFLAQKLFVWKIWPKKFSGNYFRSDLFNGKQFLFKFVFHKSLSWFKIWSKKPRYLVWPKIQKNTDPNSIGSVEKKTFIWYFK